MNAAALPGGSRADSSAVDLDAGDLDRLYLGCRQLATLLQCRLAFSLLEQLLPDLQSDPRDLHPAELDSRQLLQRASPLLPRPAASPREGDLVDHHRTVPALVNFERGPLREKKTARNARSDTRAPTK